jgi:uncharacterized protein (TIGR02466 family)
MTRLNLFPTPVFVFDLPALDDVNGEIVARLLDEEARDRGLQRTNLGGWHSRMDLMTRPQQCFRLVSDTILGHVRLAAAAATMAGHDVDAACMVHAWAMVMRRGDYTVLHDHGESHWSAAYYADAGDGDGVASGELIFSDPRAGTGPATTGGLDSASYTIRPRTGTLVVFPGWLKHQVCAYEGTRPRVSISTNVVMPVAAPSAREVVATP